MRYLTPAQTKLLMDAIGKRESSDSYSCVNSIGYAGRYQFGPMALVDAGIMKPGAHRLHNHVNAVMADPAAWAIPGGFKAFLADHAMQDDAMALLIGRNERALERLGVISPKTPVEDVAGYLMTAHLLGCGGARNLFQGIDAKDAYGTKASDYFALGRRVLAPA